MPEIIKKIIEIDKIAKQKEYELEQEKRNLKKLLKEKENELDKNYKQIIDKKISEYKKDIQKNIDDKKQATSLEIQNISREIEKSYFDNKDKWIESIYNYCVEKRDD